MTSWTAIVLAPPEADDGPMVSRLPSYLHPVAGRPLIWHTVNGLATCDPAPSRVIVAAPDNVTSEVFEGIPTSIRVISPAALQSEEGVAAEILSDIVLVHGSASLDVDGLQRLLRSAGGGWLGDDRGTAAAVSLEAVSLQRLLEVADPFDTANEILSGRERVREMRGSAVVRTRFDLASFQSRIRDELVASLMDGGVTFLLPRSVLVDVDVRIGRDSIVYPGVVLEGQTTVGEETVIGPGCRIIDSWIGSGVEMKGWNYVANTSLRNRAILEPYVRRGYD